MVEVKRVNLLDQQNEMMGRSRKESQSKREGRGRGAGAASLKKMMSIDSVENIEQKPETTEETTTTSDNDKDQISKHKNEINQ